MLEQIAAEWEAGNRDRACELARQYVDEHRRDLAASFEGLSSEAFVGYVEQARTDGDNYTVARANAWALAQQPPKLTGVLDANIASILGGDQ